jgi:hypothetical protein
MTRRRKSGDDLLGVARIRAEERGGPSGIADRYEEAVRTPLPVEVPRTVGGELVPAEGFAENTLPAILDTLVSPDAIAADASRDRLDLVKNAGSLEVALDVADSIQANDSLERMLAHQLATAHVAAMKAAAVMQTHLDEASRSAGPYRVAAGVEAERMARTFGRLTGSYPAGMQTLQKLRSGGRQVVVVQHNHRNAGGQAVVGGCGAGGVKPRKRVGG